MQLLFYFSWQAEGQTALHIAAYEGDEAMIKFLQTARADANIADAVSSRLSHLSRLPNCNKR